MPAIVFAADRNGPNYVSGLSDDDIAGVLCRAAGHWGSGAEYLMQTVDQLERLGIRDANLWRLQRRRHSESSGSAAPVTPRGSSARAPRCLASPPVSRCAARPR